MVIFVFVNIAVLLESRTTRVHTNLQATSHTCTHAHTGMHKHAWTLESKPAPPTSPTVPVREL